MYNAASFIEKCLISLFTQTKTNGVEYILVDDCSSDNSISIAKEIISRHSEISATIFKHDHNQGVAKARDTGFKSAVGEYILHLDSDDWFESTMLEELFNKAKDEDSDIVVCDFWWDYRSHKNYSSQETPNNNVEGLNDLLLGKNFTVLWNKLFKRTLITDNNIYFEPGINLGEDSLFCFKSFFLAKKISYIRCAHVHYMQNENSISQTKEKYIHQYISVVQKTIEFLEDNNATKIFKSGINKQKLFCKMSGLALLQGERRNEFIDIYHEVDSQIFKSEYSFVYRLLIFLSAKGVTWPYDFYRILRAKIKSKEASV